MIEHDNLEEFRDPANYDLEEGENTAPWGKFYGDLAQTIGGPILEIGCGTGLVTIPIAKRGLKVSGIDLSYPMLRFARKKSQHEKLSVNWILADARYLPLSKSYQFACMTGNAFQAFLSLKAQDLLLESIMRTLAPNGIFAFETRNPFGYDLNTYNQEKYWFTYTSVEKNCVKVSGLQHYDPLTQNMLWTTYRRWHDGECEQIKKTCITCHFTYPQQLETLLKEKGFKILQQYGSCEKEALKENSSTIISICTPNG